MAVLTAYISRPAAAVRDLLVIEQEGYGATDGYLSRAGLYLGLLALLDGEQPAEPVCVDDCRTALYVYRRDLLLNYRLAVSHGKLGAPVREDDIYFTERLKFVMSDTMPFRYPCRDVVESRWLGDVVYDQDGGEVDPPGQTPSVDAMTLTQPVYGTLAVTYRIDRDRYDLELPAREAAIENRYSSVAYAVYTGGLQWLAVQPPPGAEESGQQCSGGWGASLSVIPPDDPGLPTAPNADAEIVIDYCSQEVISDTSK